MRVLKLTIKESVMKFFNNAKYSN